MARIRSIKPDFWESEDTSTLPAASALVYAGLWNYSDDEGRGRFSVVSTHLRLMALRPDSSMQKTKAALDVLLERKLIIVYEAQGFGPLYYIPSFKKHQHPDKPQPSKYPTPPRLFPDSSPTVPVSLPPGEEGRGEERKGIGEERGSAPPSPGMASPAPDGLEEAQVLETAARFGAWGHPPLEKKAVGIRELRALGCSHEYIRNGAQVNKPADAGFWDIVGALKAAHKLPGRSRARIPAAPTPERENAPAYAKERPPVLEERREVVQKRQDDAREKADKLLAEMDEDELAGWKRDAEAAADKAKVPASLRAAFVQTELRRKIAKDHGIEGI